MAQNEQLGRRIDELKALRDEINVRIHLGEMDARDRWDALRPRIDEVEAQVAHGSDMAVTGLLSVVDSLRASLRELKERLDAKTTH